MRYAIALAALLMAAPAAAQDQGNPLDAFAPLLGHCYNSEVPGDSGIDRHCWSEVEGGDMIRQEHEIVGGLFDGYSAFATYRYDSESGVASYRYSSNQGGKSTGTVHLEDGALVFPDEVFQPGDGSTMRMYSVFRITNSDHYTSEFRQEVGGVWSEDVLLDFYRVDVGSSQ